MLYGGLLFLVVGLMTGALNFVGVSPGAVQTLDAVPNRDRVASDSLDHGAHDSNGVTKGGRVIWRFPA